MILILALFGSAGPLLAKSAEPWLRWQRHDPASSRTVDYAAWDALLGRVVTLDGDGISRVDYAALSGPEAAALAEVVAGLAKIEVSGLNRDEQLAYWVNLYNAVTLQVVAAHYPVGSIRDIDISPGWFSDGPWGAQLVTVEGQALTLDDIEDRILRPLWQDPRVHYAVNCASIGCPNLAAEAYLGVDIGARLERAARTFVNHPRGVDLAGEKLTVSKIYTWFSEDFGGSSRSLLEHLRRFAEPRLAAALAEVEDIDGTVYDWSLNDSGG